MINTKILLTKLATVAVLTMGMAMNVQAADDMLINKDAVCTTEKAANDSLVAGLKVAKDESAMRALLAPSIKANPTNALCIMDTVKAQAPTLSKTVFQIIISLLAGDSANDPIIKRLTDENPDIIAQIAGDVEPAAGPDDATTLDTTPDGGTPGENPNQLNEDDATPPAASPSAPSA